jgi:hypothetical protein
MVTLTMVMILHGSAYTLRAHPMGLAPSDGLLAHRHEVSLGGERPMRVRRVLCPQRSHAREPCNEK